MKLVTVLLFGIFSSAQQTPPPPPVPKPSYHTQGYLPSKIHQHQNHLAIPRLKDTNANSLVKPTLYDSVMGTVEKVGGSVIGATVGGLAGSLYSAKKMFVDPN